ncbi:MAG: PAS domain-containing protein [Verrucomicrobiales bacterium]|nr:PAS domain-containing protein [Verrucomicrobiales bacterium]
MTAHGQPIGVLHLEPSQDDGFDAWDRQLLRAFTENIAIAVQSINWTMPHSAPPDSAKRSFVPSLGEAEGLYESIVGHLPAVIWRQDANHRFTWVNDRFCGADAMSREQIIGKTDFELLLPENAERSRAGDEKTISQGEFEDLEGPFARPGARMVLLPSDGPFGILPAHKSEADRMQSSMSSLLSSVGRSTGCFRRAALPVVLAGAFCAGLPPLRAGQMLFDFGAPDSPTQPGAGGPVTHWNNITTVGTDPVGTLFDLVDSEGNVTTMYLWMLARFNGANENGTIAATRYPSTATRDSLYGNTEDFNGMADIYPEFRLAALPVGEVYDLTFYASRTGVTDNRETRYTITGSNATVLDYDPANNVDETVTASGIAADMFGEITIGLEPGPNNSNGNHFTYLGALEVKLVSTGQTWLFDFGSGNSPTEAVEPEPEVYWNNLPTAIGIDPAGVLPDLVTTDGSATGAALEMVARFNGANTSGSTAATVYPTSATRDSLFGNTETFSGLDNVLPVFKLTGLDPRTSYDFTFYGSRTGVSDVRETRFTVSGSNAAVGDLDAANNVDATVAVSGVKPAATGEVTISITPGPNNNNGNHFTYLGVMQVDWTPPFTPRILVDLGATGTPTDATAGVTEIWNNLTQSVAGTGDGVLERLLTVDGTATSINWEMISRFNGANENGTQDPAPYPISATRDSMYGNTEVWSGLENIFPAFKLTGLTPGVPYDLVLYASRMGVSDNRETQFTITGATETVEFLNVAVNVDQTVSVTGLEPNAAGEISIALAPGPNNDNGNHFTYLGVLQLDWEQAPPAGPATLSGAQLTDGGFTFTLSGTIGATYQVQGSATLAADSWNDVQSVTLASESQPVAIDQAGAWQFYRAVAAP